MKNLLKYEKILRKYKENKNNFTKYNKNMKLQRNEKKFFEITTKSAIFVKFYF